MSEQEVEQETYMDVTVQDGLVVQQYQAPDPLPVPETRSQKMSRIMKEVRARKHWNSKPKKTTRPYTKRAKAEPSSLSAIDKKIVTLERQVTLLKYVRTLLEK